MTRPIKPGLYFWNRLVDETGMSGTGYVGEVAVFSDGSAVFRWYPRKENRGSHAVYTSVEDLFRIHSHGKNDTGRLVPLRKRKKKVGGK